MSGTRSAQDEHGPLHGPESESPAGHGQPGSSRSGTRGHERAIFVITGLSGAGKTLALRCFEDMGFYCVDNLVPPMLLPLVDLTFPRFSQLAVVVDTRGGEFFDALPRSVEELRERGYPVQVVFLEAADEVLLKRFSETRRRHPLWGNTSLAEAVRAEREQLLRIRGMAAVIVDSTYLSAKQLKSQLIASFIGQDQATSSMQVTVSSFGYKYGAPTDADLVFDVRFLPNPYYDPVLQPYSGLDEAVRKFVMTHPVTREFMERFTDLTSFLVPHYRSEGKTHLAIAIGCTGGRHRSVAIAHTLAADLRESGYPVVEVHRDIERASQLPAVP